MLTYWRIFPYAVAVLETLACLGFLIKGDWRMVILWAGYGIAAFALAGVR